MTLSDTVMAAITQSCQRAAILLRTPSASPSLCTSTSSFVTPSHLTAFTYGFRCVPPHQMNVYPGVGERELRKQCESMK